METEKKPTERRQHVRKEISAPLTISLTADEFSGQMRNLSKEGLLAEIKDGLRVTIKVGGKEIPATIVRVQAMNATEWSLGVHFDEAIDPEELEL